MHINLAEQEHKVLEHQLRELRDQLNKLTTSLVRASNRLVAVRQDIAQMMREDRSLVDRLEDALLGLETVESMLGKLAVPGTEDLEFCALEISQNRVREAVNYAPTQQELEGFLSSKLARGESINEHLISGSFSVRRAAKHVLKLDRKRDTESE
jgi:septal ring factor EnvC (AmiA/AmiB activator)